ncbi:hypothetical protein ACO2E2_06730 [Staphylococcus epidermidis]
MLSTKLIKRKNNSEVNKKLYQTIDLADKELSKLDDLTSQQSSSISNQIYTAKTRTKLPKQLKKQNH